jgi:hypothetical protein
MSSPASFGKTPEASFAGLRRTDSKYALTTCHGITSNGRACRRALANAGNSNSPRYTIKGTIVVPHKDQDPAVFFCWQHKEQADEFTSQTADAVEVQERTSLETVFRNLGLEEVSEEEEEEEIQTPTRALQRREHNSRLYQTSHGKKKECHIRPSKPPRVRPEVRERVYPSDRLDGRGPKSQPAPRTPRSGFMESLLGCFGGQPTTTKKPATAECVRNPSSCPHTP